MSLRACACLAALSLAACTYGRPFGLPIVQLGKAPREELREVRDPQTNRLRERSQVMLWPDGAEELHGKQELWYPDGSRRSVKRFHHGSEVPGGLSWNPDGSPRSASDEVAGEDESIELRFHYADGTLHAVGRSHDGQRTGEWSFYHPNGSLEKQGLYERGKRVGTWSVWHASGALASRGRYEEDQRVPPWQHWPDPVPGPEAGAGEVAGEVEPPEPEE